MRASGAREGEAVIGGDAREAERLRKMDGKGRFWPIYRVLNDATERHADGLGVANLSRSSSA